MSLVSRLPFPPMPDESARGLIVRLAQDNLCSSGQMCDWLELPRIDTDLIDPARASEIMGMAPDAFAAMGFITGGTEAFLGHRVPQGTSMRQSMRVCPACLLEAPYHRRIWEHRQIDACPIHRVKLLCQCTECGIGSRFGWNRWSLRSGDCGHDLACQAVADAGDCLGAAVVYRQFGLHCDGPDLPASFSSLPLSDLLDVLFFLGRTDLVIAQANPDGIASRQMSAEGAILDAGVRIALQWPESFDPFAERVRAAYPGRATIAKQYDYLHRFIMKCGREPYADMLREAYAAHLAKRDDITDTSWPDFLPPPVTGRPRVTLPDVLAILGVGRKTLAGMMKGPLWKELVPQMPSKGQVPTFRRTDVLAFRERLRPDAAPGIMKWLPEGRRTIDLTMADKMLGMGKGKCVQLGQDGFIPIGEGLPTKSRRRLLVDLEGLEAFIDGIRRLAVADEPTKPIRFVTLLQRAMARRVVTFPDLIRCILSGELHGYVAEPDKPGLAAMVFEDADVTEVLERLCSPSRTGKMSLGAVEAFLDLPTLAVRYLVKEGFLPAPSKYGGDFFDARAVESFHDLYVYRTELDNQAGVEPTPVGRSPSGRLSPLTWIPVGLFMKTALFRKADLR